MRKGLSVLIIGLFGLLAFAKPVAAETMNYSIQANIPANQIDKSKTYFDLRMLPGQEQQVSLMVTNTANEPLTLKIEANTAVTNQNGVIDYSQTDAKKDSSLKTAFADSVKGEKEVTLNANEVRDVFYTIKMPPEKFDGTIIGGFYISKVTNEKDKGEKDKVQITNKYAYVVGVQLTETDKEIIPELKLNNITPGLQNYHTAVTANLQNTEAVKINNLTVDAKVTKKGSDDVIHQTKKESLAMAPNSNFDFPISWDDQPLEPGKYTMKIAANTEDKKWSFTKEFEIKGADSSKLNKDAIEVKQTTNNWMYWVLGLLIVVVVVLILLLMRKKSGGKKDEEAKN